MDGYLEIDLTALAQRVDALTNGLARLEDRVLEIERSNEVAWSAVHRTFDECRAIGDSLAKLHDSVEELQGRTDESIQIAHSTAIIANEALDRTRITDDPDIPF